MQQVCDERAANIWTARVIPVVLMGLVGYVTWVVIHLCVDHLLEPSASSAYQPRHGAAIAILVLHFVVLLPMALCYFRLLQTIIMNPGFVPRGPQWYEIQREKEKEKDQGRRSEKRKRKRRRKRELDVEKDATSKQVERFDPPSPGVPNGNPTSAVPTTTRGSKNAFQSLSVFYDKAISSCTSDGRPAYCSHCMNWKPDRAHHSSQVDRCVLKMDHFCPWVGGIIGETSFKYFIQFLVYGALFCAFILTVMAMYVAEGARQGDKLNVNWIVSLALAGLFLFFSAGMALSSMSFAFQNVTTIENLNKRAAVWFFAFRLPPTFSSTSAPSLPPAGAAAPRSPTALPSTPSTSSQSSHTSPASQSVAATSNSPIDPSMGPPPITILRTAPGENPWDLGALENWKSIMGEKVLDWFLPIKPSPCCYHAGEESAYGLGPVVQRLRRDTGLV